MKTILNFISVYASETKVNFVIYLTNTCNHWNEAAIGFAAMEICLPTLLLTPQGYSILAVVILLNTIMSSWGILVQHLWTVKLV